MAEVALHFTGDLFDVFLLFCAVVETTIEETVSNFVSSPFVIMEDGVNLNVACFSNFAYAVD